MIIQKYPKITLYNTQDNENHQPVVTNIPSMSKWVQQWLSAHSFDENHPRIDSSMSQAEDRPVGWSTKSYGYGSNVIK
jgi:hypothetical protein